MIDCERLKNIREEHIKPLLESDPSTKKTLGIDKLKWLLSDEKLEEAAPHLEAMIRERHNIVYNKA